MKYTFTANLEIEPLRLRDGQKDYSRQVRQRLLFRLQNFHLSIADKKGNAVYLRVIAAEVKGGAA